MDESLDLQKEFLLHFHGVNYIITLTVTNGAVMTVEAEQSDTNERWTGEFTSHYIEEITHKTGNYKKFGVFVKMLLTALARDSDSVFIDLLTNSDLEMLKARKTGQPLVNSSFSSNPKSQMKRYLILTYTVEFDRVHYPLPLAYEEDPNPAALKATIRRLRQELESTRSGLSEPIEPREKELRQIITQLRQENTQLRHRLRQLESRQKRDEESGVRESPNALRKQYESTKKQLAEITAAYEKLQLDSAKELRRLRDLARGNRSASPSSARSARAQSPSAGYSSSPRRSPSPSQRSSETAAMRREMAALRRELNESRARLEREKTTTLALRSQLRNLKVSQDRSRDRGYDSASQRGRSLGSRDSSPMSARSGSRTARSSIYESRAALTRRSPRSSSRNYTRPTSATSQRSRASNDSGYISPYSQGGYSSGGGSARSAGSRRSASSRSSNASSTASRKRRKPKITSAAPETTAPMTTKRTTPPTRPPKAARASGHRSDAASDIAPPSSRAGRADLPSRESSPAWAASSRQRQELRKPANTVNREHGQAPPQPKPQRQQAPPASRAVVGHDSVEHDRQPKPPRPSQLPLSFDSNQSRADVGVNRPLAASDISHAQQQTPIQPNGPSLSAPPPARLEDRKISDDHTQAEISDIDKRIQALQQFLDKARNGILADLNAPAPAVPAGM